MALDPKDPRLTDPKFQEFEDMVGHVLDKRDTKRKADEETARLVKEAEDKKKIFPSWFPW